MYTYTISYLYIMIFSVCFVENNLYVITTSCISYQSEYYKYNNILYTLYRYTYIIFTCTTDKYKNIIYFYSFIIFHNNIKLEKEVNIRVGI